MPLIDSHAHLWDRRFDDDRAAVLARMRAAGVTRHLEVGADLTTSRLSAELAEADDSVLATAGIHPHDAVHAVDEAPRAELRALLDRPRMAAVGECGLDYFRNLSPSDVQQDVFAFHIREARARDLPLVIHERNAFKDVLAVLDAEGGVPRGGIFHCFGHGTKKAEAVIARGFVVGLGGTVTRNEAWAQQLLPWIPLEHVVLETDAPYLIPSSLPRSGRNEPAYLPLVAECIAQAKGLTAQQVIDATTETALRVLGGRHTWTEA